MYGARENQSTPIRNPHQSLPGDPAGFSHSFLFSPDQLSESEAVLSDSRADGLKVGGRHGWQRQKTPADKMPDNLTKPIRPLMEN